MKQNILKAAPSLNSLLFNKIKQLSTDAVKVRPHVPLIKFKKGSNVSKLANSEQNLSSQIHHSSRSVKGISLDEDMTPLKYKRKVISQSEMEIIEQGGCY